MRFDGIVFDLFHTLIDPEPLRPPGSDYLASIADELRFDEATFRSFWEGTYVERETTDIDLVDLVERYATSVGITISPANRIDFDGWFGVAKDAAILHPPEDLVRLVAEVGRSAKVGVLSNCYEREVRCWPDSPYAPVVDAFVGSCFIGVMKPDPITYEAVLDAIEVAPERAIFVGNGGGDELTGASRAGFGLVVHMNAFDRHGPLVDEPEQRRRATLADASADRIEDLVTALGHHAPDWFR